MTRKHIDKEIYDLTSKASVLAQKWHEFLDSMQNYYDDRSDKWQEGEKGQEWIDSVTEKVDELNEISQFGL